MEQNPPSHPPLTPSTMEENRRRRWQRHILQALNYVCVCVAQDIAHIIYGRMLKFSI